MRLVLILLLSTSVFIGVNLRLFAGFHRIPIHDLRFTEWVGRLSAGGAL